jgi:hypothetical protein
MSMTDLERIRILEQDLRIARQELALARTSIVSRIKNDIGLIVDSYDDSREAKSIPEKRLKQVWRYIHTQM